ncbi:MAG: hypothetical protein II661_03620 [Bacteroidales bacterium]|nr:hypothetical protein [Bacteroidales bacterium]
MKNDSNKMDLNQLLSTLEHAGRDNRRQQELCAMIDNLAAAETNKHRGFWWWTSRVAVAACITFFITTAVRIWFIPTAPTTKGAPKVAEMNGTEMPMATVLDTTVIPTVSHRTTRHRSNVVNDEPTVAIEELYAEESTTTEAVEKDSTEAPYFIIEDNFAPDTEPIAYNSEPEPVDTEEPSTITPDTNTPNVAQTTKPQRRRLLGGFLRRSEPSRMEGTTLALLKF